MNLLLAAILLPLHFTAPADSLGGDRAGHVRLSTRPVHSYVFYQLTADGELAVVRGYADSTRRAPLIPHAPGTLETVWLETGPNGSAVTVFVVARDMSGNTSVPSNGCVIGKLPSPLPMARTISRGRAGSTGRAGPTSRVASTNRNVEVVPQAVP